MFLDTCPYLLSLQFVVARFYLFYLCQRWVWGFSGINLEENGE